MRAITKYYFIYRFNLLENVNAYLFSRCEYSKKGFLSASISNKYF